MVNFMKIENPAQRNACLTEIENYKTDTVVLSVLTVLSLVR